MVPQQIKDALHRYVNEGIPTGSFLGAVLENDLMGAIGKADLSNRYNMFEICNYVYNTLPSSVWGNPDRVRNHLDKFKE